MSFPLFKKPDLACPNPSPEKLLDFHVLNNPARPFALLAASTDSHFCNTAISWNELGSAVVNLTQDSHFTAQTRAAAAPTIAILANSESLAYFTLMWAIMRAGCVPFPISTRNSAPAIAHLLTKTSSKQIYVQFDPSNNHAIETASVEEKLVRKQVDDVLKLLPESFAIKVFEVPSAFTLFPRLADGSEYQPDSRVAQKLAKIITPDQPAWAPLMIIHSSGTTAFPKPIYLNRISFHAWLTAPLYSSFRWEKQIVAAMILPPFHSMGIHYGMVVNLSTGAVPGFFRPEVGPGGRAATKIPNSVNIIKAMRSLSCTLAVVSPFTLADLASDPSNVELLRTMDRVAFGGGPLELELGNKLVREGVKICAAYGTTEVGPVSSLWTEPYSAETWEYFEISPHLVTRLVPQDEDRGLYELVVLSSDKHRCSLAQVENGLEPQIYHTNDILYRHPTLPLYRAVGRLDDQIMLSNSEKTNPGPMEAIMMSDPAIKSALMFGRGKPANGVIIEPEEKFVVDVADRVAVERYIDLIWPSIERANKVGPSHSRLTRNLVMVIDPRVTPLPKTAKGQVARVKALEILAGPIEEIYSRDELPVDEVLSSMQVRDSSGNLLQASVLACLQHIVKAILGRNVNVDQDLFNQGCDSLAAKHIRSRILQLTQSASENPPIVSQNIVYQHPTVLGLAEWIFNILSEHQRLKSDSDPCSPLRNMVKKYSPIFHVGVKPNQDFLHGPGHVSDRVRLT